MVKMLIVVLLLAFLVYGCAPGAGGVVTDPPQPPPDSPPDSPVNSDTPAPSPGSDPLAPQPGDDNLVRAPAFIESASILEAESYPVQYFLSLKGNLPTPCHQLRTVVDPMIVDNTLRVEVYSLVDPDVICIQVLEAFEVGIRLPEGLAPGDYLVVVNNEIYLDLTVQ